MKALVIRQPNSIAISEVPDPLLARDEVLVKVRARGICHSDLELLQGKYIIPFDYPVIPGHEWAGEVIAIGEDVTSFRQGDRVVGECVIGCGTCALCTEGNFTNCPNADHFGVTLPGGDAELTKAKPQWLHRLPDSLSYEDGALVEPFTVAYHSVRVLGGVDASETVAILGAGTIGLMVVATARGMGARVIVIEPMLERADLARRMGADVTIDPTTANAVGEVEAATHGLGADVVVEASGAAPALVTALDLCRNGGRIAFVGLNVGETMPVELGKIQAKGLRITGVVGSPYVWERALAFLARTGVDLSPIVTQRYTLDDAEQAFAMAGDRRQSVKVHIQSMD